MAISNSQYDAIMREYEQMRENARHTCEEHRQEVYELIPEYKQIEDSIADTAMESAQKYFAGDSDAIVAMKKQMEELTSRQKKLLSDYSFPEDYLTEKYQCEDCRDTGYINDKKCHCLTQRILKLLYSQSNLQEMLERENFDTLSYDYYTDGELDMMKRIVEACKSFASDFDNKYENILFCGNVGVGKTFLTNCIAKEVLDSGHSVIYFTSIRLFDTLSQNLFRKYDDEDGPDRPDVLKDIYACDLLIIDDLGTEVISSFVAARLFDILNERDISRRSTIISTNLSAKDIQERYSERNISRIFGSYKALNPKVSDIRLKKRKQGGI